MTFTVSELTREIHALLNERFDDVRVAGEISGYKLWSSGHAYFTLKDAGATLRCVLFRSTLRYMRLKPADGMAVVARGAIEVRAERGEYQLIVASVEPQGLGELMMAFERVKSKLEAEGLFAPQRKRPLPAFPKRIGIVTSPKGAVIRDMVSVLRRRFPGLEIRLWPAAVQGPGAVEEVCEGLRWFGESDWPDVVIVGRGGGSLEDLWTFNEEAVARAIAASPVPVISAVGHETDYTIADFVADVRAATPSAAAEIVVAPRADLLQRIRTAAHRSGRAMELLLSRLARRFGEQGIERAAALVERRINLAVERIDECEEAMRDGMRQRLLLRRRRAEDLERRLRAQDLRLRLADRRARLQAAGAALSALSPLNVLSRGYAVVQTPEGAVVKAAAQAPAGTPVKVRLAQGRLGAVVTESEA